jgi:hypothetical protein
MPRHNPVVDRLADRDARIHADTGHSAAEDFTAWVIGVAREHLAATLLLVPGPWAQIMTPVGVPFPWEGVRYLLDGATLVITWSYGAIVAIAAAVASLAAASVSLVFTMRAPRSEPTRVVAPRPW